MEYTSFFLCVLVAVFVGLLVYTVSLSREVKDLKRVYNCDALLIKEINHCIYRNWSIIEVKINKAIQNGVKELSEKDVEQTILRHLRDKAISEFIKTEVKDNIPTPDQILKKSVVDYITETVRKEVQLQLRSVLGMETSLEED